MLLAVLLISVLLGALRGLVFEVMSLAGWLVAYAAAYIYAPRLPPLWSPHALPADPATGAAVMPLVAFGLVFAGVLIVWNLLSHLIRMLVRATPLSGIDRAARQRFRLRARGAAAARDRGRRRADAVGQVAAVAAIEHRAAARRGDRLDQAIAAARPSSMDGALIRAVARQ